MGVAVAHRRRTIPRHRLVEADGRPRLYLVPSLPEDEPAEAAPASAMPPAGMPAAVPAEAVAAEDVRVHNERAEAVCVRRVPVPGARPNDSGAGWRDDVASRLSGAARASMRPTPARRHPIHYPDRRLGRRARRRPVRWTRRGRFVLSALVLGVTVGLTTLLAPAGRAPAPPRPARTVVVRPGDTLWSISVRALPSQDPYRAVDQVRRLNHMRDDAVFVGEQLTLPSAG